MAIRERHVFIITALYFALVWVAILLVDVADLNGSRGSVETPLWAQLFALGGPTEWVQWHVLAAAVIVMGFASGRQVGVEGGRISGHAGFWAVMSIAVLLLLIEDAGNVRNGLRHLVRLAAETFAHSGTLDLVVMFAYFAALAAVPLYALIRYGRFVREHVASLAYVLAGLACYGAAAISMLVRNFAESYTGLGIRLHAALGLVVPAGRAAAEMGHSLIDRLLEESLELLGAAFLLAAAISCLRAFRHRPGRNARREVS